MLALIAEWRTVQLVSLSPPCSRWTRTLNQIGRSSFSACLSISVSDYSGHFPKMLDSIAEWRRCQYYLPYPHLGAVLRRLLKCYNTFPVNVRDVIGPVR